jgi:thiosulfate/3-mercaptopyruvate sulfurtransferase
MTLFSTLISAQALARHSNQSNWVIFDCRFSLADPAAGEKAYRLGHIPGARYAHLDRDLSASIRDYTGRHPLPNSKTLAEKLGRWGVNNASQIVVYDDVNGAIAGRMWWLLRSLGHDNVALLDGGLPQWLQSGYVTTTALPHYQTCQYRAYPNPDNTLSALQVENGLAQRSIKLIDARATERFKGLQEPIDPVAGHIPKAVNRPFQHNLDQQGCFLPPVTLRQQFSDVIGQFSPEQIVHMCGSGVTACHNLLAMEIAGLSGSKLYPGSWSEWIRNHNRPVSTP